MTISINRVEYETVNTGDADHNIGALLRGIDKDGVERGRVITKPGSVTPMVYLILVLIVSFDTII